MRPRTSLLPFLSLFAVWCSLFSMSDAVYLTLKRYGTRVAANSVININQVGRENGFFSRHIPYYGSRYTNSGPLVCNTNNNEPCCRPEDNPEGNDAMGDWYYPNGDAVGSSNSYSTFYVTRGPQELALEKAGYNNSPSGVYCCDIDSVNGTMNGNRTDNSTSVCVGLYDYSTLRRCNNLHISWGTVNYDSPYIPGRVATFTCNPGYMLVGPTKRVCTAYGWTGYAPRCEFNCGPPPTTPNGVVNTPGGTTTNQVATYTCNEGYRLIGTNSMICDKSGSRRWTINYYYYYKRAITSEPPACVDSTTIQIKFSPTENCFHFGVSNSNRPNILIRSLTTAIVNAINEHSVEKFNNLTTITTRNIENGFFSCRTVNQFNQTVFRATLLGTRTVSAAEIATVLQSWVLTSPSIRLEWYVVDIHGDCPVRITSLFEPECGVNTCETNCRNICNRRNTLTFSNLGR